MSRALAWSVREREEGGGAGGEAEAEGGDEEGGGVPSPPSFVAPPVRTFHRPASRPYFSVVSSASVFLSLLSLRLAATRARVRRRRLLLRLLLLLLLEVGRVSGVGRGGELSKRMTWRLREPIDRRGL